MDAGALSARPSVLYQTSRCLDVVSAIHVIADPSHHGFASAWAAEVRSSMTPSAASAIDVVSTMPMKGLELSGLICLLEDIDDVEGFTRVLPSLSPAEFSYWALEQRVPLIVLTSFFSGKSSMDKVFSGVLRRTGDTGTWVRTLLRDPLMYRDSAAALMKELAPAIAEQTDRVSGTMRDFMERLRCRVEAASIGVEDLMVELSGSYSANPAASDLYIFMCSWFISPHCIRWSDLYRSFCAPDWSRMLQGEEREQAKKLGRLAGALADANRLMIIRELAREGSSGRSLAPSLGLTPATMAHHLDVLISAGLIVRENLGKSRTYFADLERLDAAVDDIRNYLTYGAREK